MDILCRNFEKLTIIGAKFKFSNISDRNFLRMVLLTLLGYSALALVAYRIYTAVYNVVFP